MNKKQNNWDSLWALFEKITNNPQEKQNEILSKAEVSEEIKKELLPLLEAHYSKSPVLDNKPEWKSEIDKAFQPPKEIHGYKIQQKLGEGGVGEVYLATKAEKGFTRKVAIKFATMGRFSKHVLNSFNTELEVLLSLNHSNIERLYDGGITQDNIPFLIVEFIDGFNIDEHCEKSKLDVKQRLRLFQKVCGAIDAVHRSLIVHRDIKASNIMVGVNGEPKLLDFGLAKLSENEKTSKKSHTTISSQMMTLAYASPEQIKGQRITTASDVYSLGVLLYFLLTGKLPYEIKTEQLVDTYKSITEKQAKLASKNTNKTSEVFKVETNLSKKLSGDLEQIIARAINKKPENRYISAAQLSEDIENFLNNRPVIAKRDSTLYRVGKFVQRHKASVSLFLLTVASLITLSVNLYIQSTSLKQSIIEIKKEQKRVVQVTEFLKNIFKISDPLLTDKKIVEVKDLLDYSSLQLDNDFNDETLTKATLYLTLGNVYLNMSNLEQAENLFNKANDLYEMNKNKTGLLNVSLAQIRLLQQQGNINQAHIKSTELYNKTEIKDLMIKAQIEVLHGQNQFKLGQITKAEKTLKSALDYHLLIYGKEHDLVVDIYLLLGNVYWRLGDYEKVKHNYQKAYDINNKKYGQENHKTLKSRSSLGVLAYALGNYNLALHHLSFVAHARLKKLGKKHIITAEAYNRLGAVFYESGNHIKAQNALELAKEAYIDLKLNNTLKYAKTLNNLGLVERQNKLYEQAKQTFLEAQQIEIDVLGTQHSDIASMHNNLGMVAADLGDYNQAMKLFKKSHDLIVNTSGSQDINLGFSMTNIGRMYLQRDNLLEASKWIEKALELRENKLGKENLYYIESLSAMAEIYVLKNQLDKANKELKKIISVREKKLPAKDWRIAEAKALYALTVLTDQESKSSYFCNMKLIAEKLGIDHYRTQRLRNKQKLFNIAEVDISVDTNENCQ